MIKYIIVSLLGMFIGGWLIGTSLNLWNLSTTPDQVGLILACVLLLTNSWIIWFKIVRKES
jgi:hypothetical protein